MIFIFFKLIELNEALTEDSHEVKGFYLEYDNQTDNKRLLSNRIGFCTIASSLSYYGVFWICPFIRNISGTILNMSNIIKNYIETNNYKSFKELCILPEIGQFCFVTIQSKNYVNECSYRRGYIERYNKNTEKYMIRLMDYGPILSYTTDQMYPYEDINGLDCNFRAIRCVLTDDQSIIFDEEVCNKFEKLKYLKVEFELVKQVWINGVKCWLTEIRTHNCLINSMILYHQEQTSETKKQNNF